MIRIMTGGSFGQDTREFTALNTGHADCVAQVIEYLSKRLLPVAIAKDHQLHEKGEKPSAGFGSDGREVLP